MVCDPAPLNFAVPAVPRSKVLVLEFGEELEDAFTLMEVLREHGLPLLQVGRHDCCNNMITVQRLDSDCISSCLVGEYAVGTNIQLLRYLR
jgi:hypothetical protein